METEGLLGPEVKEFDLSSSILQFLAKATGCHSCATNKLSVNGHYQKETTDIEWPRITHLPWACDPVLHGNSVPRLGDLSTNPSLAIY